MNKLQEVQKQITKMIKSDYPNPIFKHVDHNKMIFQFNDLSYHGGIEIEIYNEGEDIDIILDSNMGSTIDNNCQTVEEFMNEFKGVYKLEQEMLVEHTEQMSL